MGRGRGEYRLRLGSTTGEGEVTVADLLGKFARGAAQVRGAVTQRVHQLGIACAIQRVQGQAGAFGWHQWAEVARLRTAFVQVADPWLRPSGGSRLPEGLESPDGTLVGLLAGNALSRGTQRSALNLPVRGIAGLEPVITRSDPEGFLPDTGASADSRPRLQRLSAFGPTTTGIRLLSDVTTSPDRAWAPGQVNRLMSAIIRASRVAGEALLFENSGEDLWAAVTETLESVLEGFWREGAFAGDSTRDAFDVRCDRRTITQADIDAGRVIARIEFTPAAALDRITVLFSLQEGGHLSLLGRDPGSSMEAGE